MAVFWSAKCTNEEAYVLQRLFRAASTPTTWTTAPGCVTHPGSPPCSSTLNSGAVSSTCGEVEERGRDIIAGTNARPPPGRVVVRRAGHGAAARRSSSPTRGPTRSPAAPTSPPDEARYRRRPLQRRHARGDRAGCTTGLHRRRTRGFEAVARAVEDYTPERAEEITGVPAEVIRQLRAGLVRGRGPGRRSGRWASSSTPPAPTSPAA